jgi:CCR4-NOT transcription complex subunit 1
MENSLSDFVQELGYSFTASLDECRSTFTSLGGKDMVTPTNVARLLAMMARTHVGLNADNPCIFNPITSEMWTQQAATDMATTSGWNVDVLIQVVGELVPNFAWKEVPREFDFAEFFVRDKSGLRIIAQALKKIPRDIFPIEVFYKLWRHSEAQVSLLTQCVKHPDVFYLAEYPCRRTTTECLKAQPEDDNRHSALWRSLNLIEILLQLSDKGQYATCSELFKPAIASFPDLLMLGLLQANVSVALF